MPEYDGNAEGTYIFTAVLPEGYAYAEEALAIWEEYETLTQEQQAQIPEELLAKLTAWVELAEQVAGSRKVMAAVDGDGWTDIESSNLKWKLENGTLTISGTGDMPDWSTDPYAPWDSSRQCSGHRHDQHESVLCIRYSI